MATGEDIVRKAEDHLREEYVFGARAPMGDSRWKGPWDCAEFASWCLYQTAGVLFGTEPANDPMRADAFTGFWAEQAEAASACIGVADAAAVVGAFVLRRPLGNVRGHIVISDGRGGTVEAHSSRTGVVRNTLSGRRWDMGILPPGVEYYRSVGEVAVAPPPATILRLTAPLTRGPLVRRVQEALRSKGFPAGRTDGIYGPQTASAVRALQAARGLVVDGEVGPATFKALGIRA